MPNFNAKMHQNRLRLGLRPDPAGRAYSAPPDPLAGFKGPTSKGMGGDVLVLDLPPRFDNPGYGPDIVNITLWTLKKNYCLSRRLDQTLGKPGAWMVNGNNKEKQKQTVVARLSRIETQVPTHTCSHD